MKQVFASHNYLKKLIITWCLVLSLTCIQIYF